MQAEFVNFGNTVNYTPSSAVTGGSVVVLAGRIGVAIQDIAANVQDALYVSGIFRMVKATGAINDGAVVYWDADGNPASGDDAGTGAATATSSANTFAGFAVGAAAEGDETMLVHMVGVGTVANTIHMDLTNVIIDPGDAGAIPIALSGSCQITTAGSETRTLAAPTNVGQMMCLHITSDGGTAVITSAAAINQTGNTVITMADAGDTIVLVGIQLGAAKVWRILANDGCDLSTP
jgi:predicted RecA/RadA family phage recombinase